MNRRALLRSLVPLVQIAALTQAGALVQSGASLAQTAQGRRRQGAPTHRPAGAPGPVAEAVRAFAALGALGGARVGCMLTADPARGARQAASAPLWRAAHEPDGLLFVGDAIASIILAELLRQQEGGKLSGEALAVIDDSVRSLPSPVFRHLTGRTSWAHIIEAMIGHGDHTAMDIALRAASPGALRALLKSAGLKQTRIPDATRSLFGWLAGGPAGVDPGWEALQAIFAGARPLTRAPDQKGDGAGMLSTPAELVAWHQAALGGRFFETGETLAAYRRFMAITGASLAVAPPGLAVLGGQTSMDLANFHCMTLAGQMQTPAGPVTFSFVINWRGPQEAMKSMASAYREAARHTLAEVAREMNSLG